MTGFALIQILIKHHGSMINHSLFIGCSFAKVKIVVLGIIKVTIIGMVDICIFMHQQVVCALPLSSAWLP